MFQWFTIVACVCVVLAGAAMAADKTAKDLNKEAEDLIQKGLFDEALKSANQAIELDGKNANAHLLRGEAYEGLLKKKEEYLSVVIRWQ